MYQAEWVIKPVDVQQAGYYNTKTTRANLQLTRVHLDGSFGARHGTHGNWKYALGESEVFESEVQRIFSLVRGAAVHDLQVGETMLKVGKIKRTPKYCISNKNWA